MPANFAEAQSTVTDMSASLAATRTTARETPASFQSALVTATDMAASGDRRG